MRRVLATLPILGLLIGLVILAVPVASDWIATREAEEAISVARTSIELAHDPSAEELLEQANAYNASLVGDVAGRGILGYDDQLSYDGSAVMCWVNIPSIDVTLPVYHGTDEDSLAAGAGHLEGSSLPVGGTSTHCVITAHSGMRLERAFDDIESLDVGDVFVVWTLGMPYAYEVTSQEVVLPSEVESLGIAHGEDLCTLVTCTPYGVNSHRLLVHGSRCAYTSDMEQATVKAHVNRRTIPLLAAMACIIVTTIILSIASRKRRRKDKSPMERRSLS